MKAIKTLTILIFGIIILISCNPNDDSAKIFRGDDFVRFSLVLDANDNPIEYPLIPPPAFVEESEYEKSSLTTLKIPVTLTTTRDIEDITVNFEAIYLGNVSATDFTILPSDGNLNFSNNKLTDTIVVNQLNKISNSNAGQIKLNLVSTSDSKIKLGYDRDLNSLESLIINILPTATSIYFFEKTREEILGTTGEIFDFKIIFPNGFIASEIEDVDLFGITSPFDISIVQQPITSSTEITYKATVNENLPEDSSFDALLNLIEIEGYTLSTITSFQITKPSIIPRSGNPAGNFYDLNTANYRLRGDYWRTDDDNPGRCEWFSQNVFSVPVIVEADNPDAILFDNMGTNDEEDDIYHHRFKIGFVGPNPPIGTNPFALRNLLEGESNISPGLNLIESIEFFPKNGNSSTQGSMTVISQIAVLVRTSDDTAFNIPISGSGTYQLIDASTNLWRMDFEVTYDFSAINGTIKTLPFVMYNQPGQPEPGFSSSECFEPLEL